MKNEISLVMITKNESEHLERCLANAKDYVDEIVIVDTGSVDATKQIAQKFTDKIYDYLWEDDFSAARNFALSKSSSAWNLVLDADEYITKFNRREILNFIQGQPFIGKVKIFNKFAGADGDNYELSNISRLFPAHCRFVGKIHEQIDSTLPRILLDIEVQHTGYYKTNKSQRNIPLLQRLIAENPADPYYHYQIAKEYRGLEEHHNSLTHLKMSYKCIDYRVSYAPNVVVNLLYAMISSGDLEDGLHIIEKEQGFLHESPDFHFVAALYLLELILIDSSKYNNLLPYIEQFYLRALEIGESSQDGSVLGTGSFAAHHNLGVFYEVTGRIEQAREQYLRAASYNYEPSLKRLAEMT